MNSTHPAWLKLLNIEFARQPIDSLDDLARLAALPTVRVEDILDNTLLPSSQELRRLVNAITTNNDMRRLIIHEYSRAVGLGTAPPVPTDMQMLTNAINDLTATIQQVGIFIPRRRRVIRRFPRPGE